MPARNPRVHVVLDWPLYRALGDVAGRNGVSLSLAARDLIREALELQEDVGLGWIAEQRRRAPPRRLLTHDQMLRRLGLA